MNRRGVIRRGGLAAVGLTVIAVLMLAACGGTDRGSSGAEDVVGDEPASNGTLAPAELVDLPLPGGSQLSDGPAEIGAVWTQSFRVDGLSPEAAMGFYETALGDAWSESVPAAALAGCTPTASPVGDGGCTYRGTWKNGAESLQITASPDVTDASDLGNGTVVSFSLTGAE